MSLTGDAAGVERPHGELGSRLADGLGGDDADRLTQLDRLPGGHRAPVAGAADAVGGLAGEHRAGADAVELGIVAEEGDLGVADLGAGGDHGAVGQRDRVGQHPTEDAGLEVLPLAGTVRRMFSIQMPRVVPQSSSRTISSWATSTSRRVR